MSKPDTRKIVVVGRPLPGNRYDCREWAESGAQAAAGKTATIADGGYPGTGSVMPHRRRKGEELPDWKQAHNKFVAAPQYGTQVSPPCHPAEPCISCASPWGIQ